MKTSQRQQWSIMVRAAVCVAVASLAAATPVHAQFEPDGPYAPVTELPDDLKLIDGDIAMPRDWEELRATYTVNLWPDGIVPYEFGPNVTQTNQTLMRAAMDEWESLANVRFVPRNSQIDYVFIRNATFNASEGVGTLGGQQRIYITSWTNHGTLVHELGHVLAYWHEQSRADRNDYVDIKWNNVCQNCCSDADGNPISCNSQFAIRDTGGEHGPYDFASVMHYPACAWSSCATCTSTSTACRTIDVLPPNDTTWQNAIGGATNASYWDGRIMSFLYPENNWVFVGDDGLPLWNGTFLFPYPSVSLGYDNTPTGGTLWLKPGEYGFTGTLDRPMRIEATFGSASIGL